MDSSETNSHPNPREKANPLSVLFWWWTIDSFKKGYVKELGVEDLYDPLKIDRSTILGDKLEKQWEIELRKSQILKREPSLLKTIFITFQSEVLLMGLIHAIQEFVVKLGLPLLLGLLLQYFKSERQTSASFRDAILYAMALSAANFFCILKSNHLLFEAYHIGGRIRIAVCSLVYRKALRLSKTALGETAPGKIVNLIANDVSRFDVVLFFFHNLWSTPLSTMLIAYYLFTEARYAPLIGISVFYIVVLIQVYTSKLTSKYRLQTAIKTDERVRLMDEIISGVQIIKMYAWEKPFCALVELARKLELKIIKKNSYLRGIFMTFYIFTKRMALYVTIVAMLMYDQPLSTEKIFVFTSFYNLVDSTTTLMFVRGFAEIIECRVSVKRIQSFLLLDEFRTGNVTNTANGETEKKSSLVTKEVKKAKIPKKNEEKKHKMDDVIENNDESDESYSVIMNQVTAKWYPTLSENTLEDINLKLEKGKLYAVIGMVGSGKSSLLSSILGEINLIEGNIRVEGRLSYVDQDAWVFGASVRQNILFGQEFDRQRYQMVVKACSLSKDFAQFPNGDHTIVGERGSSLSGGQKARINLARAIYKKADIYLLDDPLSAVDAHVGKHLFEECIRRYLKGKTRILATHQLQYIKDVNGIIFLGQGKMKYYENYHRLLEAYPEYNNFISVDKDKNDDLLAEKTDLRKRFSSTRSKFCEFKNEDAKLGENDKHTRKLEDIIEGTSKGVVKGNKIIKYFMTGSNLCTISIMIILFILTQVLASLNDVYLLYIVNADESRNYYKVLDNENATLDLNKVTVIPEENFRSIAQYIYVYTIIILSLFVIGSLRSFVYYNLCMRSGEHLHNLAFTAIIHTNLRFFDLNPSGRIMNRFSKDMGATDELLPKSMFDCSQALLLALGALIVTCTINPIFLAPALVIIGGCYLMRNVCLKTIKNIKRLEGMTKSPVFTHLNATLNGISTIRAYQAQNILKQEFDKFQDLHTSSWYMYTVCYIAYALNVIVFSYAFITLVIFSFLIFKDHFNNGDVGLGITQMLSVIDILRWGMLQSAEIANQMMSVERIFEYTQIPPESNLKEKGNTTIACKKIKNKEHTPSLEFFMPPKNWPNKGTVEFKNVSMKYYKEDEPVLKGLNFLIKPSEKVGIVGRTGAGKSSLIVALFRLAELEGIIEIDGIDTGSIPIEELRSHISIIPQDPVLFSGTLRRNLDPFNQHSDEALWQVVEEVELRDAIVSLGNGLDCRVLDRGSNFSVGQRQLICLARAILRNDRILLLDEATANVDSQTDSLIQHTIRSKFAQCTVLTIAHRLNTIIDNDRVLVMDRGSLVEFDHPYNLLRKKTSQFTSLVQETGDAMFKQLFEISKKCYDEKYYDTRL